MKKILLLAGAILFFASCHQSSQNNSGRVDSLKLQSNQPGKQVDSLAWAIADGKKPVIIPGKSIGNIVLREQDNTILSKLKQPTSGDAAMCHSIAKWRYGDSTDNQEELDIYSVCDTIINMRKAVQQVRISGTLCRLPANLNSNSTFAAIQQQFPNLTIEGSYATKDGKKLQLYDDIKKGICFEFPINNDSLPTDNACYAVTIHVPGRKATDAYLAFFSDSLQVR